jgi:hypothetical protein
MILIRKGKYDEKEFGDEVTLLGTEWKEEGDRDRQELAA